jgi:hypothetical protein
MKYMKAYVSPSPLRVTLLTARVTEQFKTVSELHLDML